MNLEGFSKESKLALVSYFMAEDFLRGLLVGQHQQQTQFLCGVFVGAPACLADFGRGVVITEGLCEETRNEILAKQEMILRLGWYFIRTTTSPLGQALAGQMVHVVGFNLVPGAKSEDCEAYVCPLSQFESDDTDPIKVLVRDLSNVPV